MTLDAGDELLRAVRDHNPWWQSGTEAFDLPARQKSDFYHLARPDDDGSRIEDADVLGLVGRGGVGKTTLLKQFVHHEIQSGADPVQFLYLPFDADPLYQLRSDQQLRQAVKYYESRVLGSNDADKDQFLLLDDVHRIEHPNKPGIDGWGDPVSALLEDPRRHVVVTASAEMQVERELDRAGVESERYDIQPILPEKFRDYLFTLYPDLEAEPDRISPSSLRSGENSLPACIEAGTVDPLVEELRRKYDKVADHERTIQSQVGDYLAMGGVISYEREGAVASAAELSEADYRRLREDVRGALYQEVPGFESIKTIADLERLCALAARDRGEEPFRYQELVDLFDVDRRTIADSYLPALEELFVLTGITEYDNQRPRSVRLYLRDTGLVAALAAEDPQSVRQDFDFEADLARVAAFDHTMRFAFGIDAARGKDADPSVQFWQGRNGEVEFVFEVDGTPVPVGLAYRSSEHRETVAVVREFVDSYDAPVGMVLAGDTIQQGPAIEAVADGVVQVPYWLYLTLC